MINSIQNITQNFLKDKKNLLMQQYEILMAGKGHGN